MLPGRVAPLAIDLSRIHRRSVTSLFSNLVTRPTGRAIRMGVESQIAELEGGLAVCLSILDFSQVRVLDYSCADEIVAKLLLRYQGAQRPAEAFFLARGLQEHHLEPIEEVLDRHDLLLAAEPAEGPPRLLGRADPVQRRCWESVGRIGRAAPAEIASGAGLGPEAADAALGSLALRRVVIAVPDGGFCALSHLLQS